MRRHQLLWIALAAVLLTAGGVWATPPGGDPDDIASLSDSGDPILGIELWQDGIIYYRRSKGSIASEPPTGYPSGFWPALRLAMNEWETATYHRIRFVPCDNLGEGGDDNLAGLHGFPPLDCDDVYPEVTPLVIVRPKDDFGSYGYRDDADDGDKDGVGATVRWNRNETNRSDMTHELGHVIGLWHEQNRVDAMRWLTALGRPLHSCSNPRACVGVEYPYSPSEDYGYASKTSCSPTYGACVYWIHSDETQSEDILKFPTRLVTKGQIKEPLVGNYDYDSIMHYGTACNAVACQWLDAFGNQFDRRAPATPNPKGTPSPRDVSRVLQYYAHEAHPKWGFFRSLSRFDSTDPTTRPDPSLDPSQGPLDTWPAGTPAIAFQSEGSYDLFVRGNDTRLYWRNVRNGDLEGSEWKALALNVCSDPAAVSWGPGRVDVVWISCDGDVRRKGKRSNDSWHTSKLVVDGGPAPFKETVAGQASPDDGYLGPAVASRGKGKLDVFAVIADGRLASVSYAGGDWDPEWRIHGAAGSYDVDAQPAALGTSGKRVQLALNVGGNTLYQPAMSELSGKLHWPGIGDPVYTGLATGSPAALARRDSASRPFRTLVVNGFGVLVHNFAASSSWREIGGIPLPGSGPAAVASGPYGALILMTGEDAIGVDRQWIMGNPAFPQDPSGVGGRIQSGGLWLREFE